MEYTQEDALAEIREAYRNERAHKAAFNALMAGGGLGDASACRAVIKHGRPVEDAICCLSTSEKIAVALSFGRMDLLPEDYQDFRYAWRRLDDRQRHLVDTLARASWLY